MTRVREFAVALGIFSLAVLPGCSTWETHRSSGQYSQAGRSTQAELAPGMVQQVQTSLQRQGLYNGAVDGAWGPVTQSAVQSYQQAHGLSATGQIDSPTLASLNLASDGTVPAAAVPPQQVAAPAPPVAPAQANTPPAN